MVEVVLPEENRRGVMAADNIRTERAHPLHQRAPEVEGIGELAIGEAEVLDTGQADEGRRRLELPGALDRQFPGLDSRIGPKYLKGAVSYGGPCFPRDNLAMGELARRPGVSRRSTESGRSPAFFIEI